MKSFIYISLLCVLFAGCRLSKVDDAKHINRKQELGIVINDRETDENRLEALRRLILVSNFKYAQSTFGIDHKIFAVTYDEKNKSIYINATLDDKPIIIDKYGDKYDAYYPYYKITINSNGDVEKIQNYIPPK